MRALILFLLLLEGAFSISLRGAELRKVTLRLDWYPQAENGGYFCARAEGLYRAAGLDVDIIPAITTATVEPVVALGNAEFGLSTTDRLLMARGRGLPVVAIMASMEHDATAIMVHADSPVKDFPDLDGHTIAAPPGVVWLPYIIHRYNLKHVGEIRHTFENATFMHDPNYIEEILVTAEPYFMQQNHVAIRYLPIMNSGCDSYRLLISSEKLIAADPAMVRAFVEASREGWRRFLADGASTFAEVKRANPETTQGQFDFSRQAMIDGHFVDGFAAKGEKLGLLTEARFDAQYALMRSINVLDHDFDFHPAFTTAFLASPK